MLEVVFSDSVAGAMLVAIGHQHSVGGATAVIFANEDGEQNATIPQAEIEKFQREAEERERRGWENAVPFEGKRENIVNLPLALSVGHISQTGIGTEREEAISLLTGTFPDIASQVVEEMLDTARKSYAVGNPSARKRKGPVALRSQKAVLESGANKIRFYGSYQPSGRSQEDIPGRCI